jgi:hypothetical protein
VASTSFAQNKNFIKSSQAGSKCMSGAKPTIFKLGQSGFEQDEITVTEGEFGPEIKIGDTRLFYSLTSDQTATTRAQTEEAGNWHMLGKETKKLQNCQGLKGSCPAFNEAENPAKPDGPKKSVVITTSSGKKIRIRMLEEKKGGKVVSRKLRIEGDDGSEAGRKKFINIIPDFTKQKTSVTAKMRIESKAIDGDKVTGVIESGMKGTIPESSASDPSDPDKELKFSSCSSTQENGEQCKNQPSGDSQNSTFDLSGTHVKLCGSKRFNSTQYSPNEDRSEQTLAGQSEEKTKPAAPNRPGPGRS